MVSCRGKCLGDIGQSQLVMEEQTERDKDGERSHDQEQKNVAIKSSRWGGDDGEVTMGKRWVRFVFFAAF